MKKFISFLLITLIIQLVCCAQDNKESTKDHKPALLLVDPFSQDTARVLQMVSRANYYKHVLPDSAFHYGYNALSLARQTNFPKGEVSALFYIAITHFSLGNYAEAVQLTLQGLRTAESHNLVREKASLLLVLAEAYNEIEDHSKALALHKEARILFHSALDYYSAALAQNAIGETYLKMKLVDSALYHCQKAYEEAGRLKISWLIPEAVLSLAKIQQQKGNNGLALTYLPQLLTYVHEPRLTFDIYSFIAQVYERTGKGDSSIHYATKALEAVKGRGFYVQSAESNVLLSRIYQNRDPQKSLAYSAAALAYKDSLFRLARSISVKNFIAFDEQERQYEIAAATTAYRSRVKQTALIAGLVIVLLVAFLLYRNVRHRKRAYERLQLQKLETESQKELVEKTLKELKSTQVQLIQREKMASLGELTAGIAHEIQNPLNFVNNFSAVNKELVVELQQEAQSGNTEEVLSIAGTIAENEEKISHHGKRADSIVKSMLQHSRDASGESQLTDMNQLVEEHLRLAYHGYRAKDQSFNTDISTVYDPHVGQINVVPQDIGRVLLNLFNNAFYAMQQKKQQQNGTFEPVVTVSTQKRADHVVITVRDNGTGMPQNVADKVFQPFFTTKPTGEGTGLGLSLSYDIVTKGHGGNLSVKSSEGEGSEFVITIPTT